MTTKDPQPTVSRFRILPFEAMGRIIARSVNLQP